MRYISTRGAAPALEFDEVLLAGLARDGGLYLPESWPQFSRADIRSLRGLTYAELVHRVISPFVGDCISDARLSDIVTESYRGFQHPAVAPLKQLEPNLWLMELFHGPTLAFKDYAMQILGRLFDEVLLARDQEVTIVGATSGDTGSAAIEACRDRQRIKIFILHPKGRVSEVQRRQMTTVMAPNLRNVAIEGSFDDCQDLVKALFNDQAFRDEMHLSAVNSINWARILPQIAYYFAAGVALGAPERSLSFAVPSGNFGNVFAGYAAKAMGLPIERLVVGSNRNDILTRFFNSGRMAIEGVEPSLSPSMDIQVSSNFERLLYDLLGRDGSQVAQVLGDFRRTGSFSVNSEALALAREHFDALRLSDSETLDWITRIHRGTGELLDPHSAIGVAAAEAAVQARPAVPVVALATAHPAKFPDAVQKASGCHPALPPRMANLFERPERSSELPADAERLKIFVREETSAMAKAMLGSARQEAVS
jgi:threonine synthase